jgi:hypothetical protein
MLRDAQPAGILEQQIAPPLMDAFSLRRSPPSGAGSATLCADAAALAHLRTSPTSLRAAFRWEQQ